MSGRETFVIGECQTEHYTFHAIGRTESEARDGLLEVMRAHGAQSDGNAWRFGGMDPDPVYALDEYYGANYTDAIAPGEGVRDWSRVSS